MSRLKIDRLSKSFGDADVVKEFSLDIESGEFVVILGPSGCGKSTILRTIAGLEQPTSGVISIDGRRVDHLPPKERGCGMIFQNYALYPHMSVRANLGYGLRVAGMARAAREAKVAEISAMLELDGLLERKPRQLSGGQRQRVAIGRAIAREPKLLLLDEPLSNLDAKLRSTMRAELRKLHDRIGATSIFVTHDQMEAMSLADRIVIVNEGRLEQYGAPAEVYGHPKTLFVAGFLGAPPMNLFPGRIQRDPLRFECGEGVAIPLPPDLAHAPPGKRLVLGIRPEDVSVVHANRGEGALQARVEHVENLGAILHLHCSVGKRQITLASRDHPDVRRGAEISLRVDATRIGLFDADSGHAVEHC